MKKVVAVVLLSWFAGVIAMWAQTDTTLLVIDGCRVALDEYRTYCRLCRVPESEMAERLDDFIDFKLKAHDASCQQVDTLPEFGKLLSVLKAEAESREDAESNDGNFIRRDGWVKVEILTIPIRQDAGSYTLNAMKDDMESIRRELHASPNCSLSKVAERWQYRSGERWMPLAWFVPEEISVIRHTSVGELSEVFLSAAGVNLLRVIDKTDDYSRTQMPELGLHLPLRDILLAVYWDNLLDQSKAQNHVDEQQLAAYFKQNIEQYEFDLPHYKGLIVYCANKADARAIQRKLRKTDYSEWPERIKQMVSEQRIGKARAEYGLFRIGSNDATDCLAFKCVQLKEDADYPYVFIKGKILKRGPERWEDVASQVHADYVSDIKFWQMSRLRQKYAVEVFDECLH